ncbi:MAG: DNA polymerase [Terriglobales bacterium]
MERFAEVVLVDFEFQQADGELPRPVCLVARELKSGRRHRLMLDGDTPPAPPYPVGPDTLVVSYAASSEAACHLVLGWRLPANSLDLHAEFCRQRAGLGGGRSILDAQDHHGIGHIDRDAKADMRQAAMAWYNLPGHAVDEREAMLAYCESDVAALADLLPQMLPELETLPESQVLLRGEYATRVAQMEHLGVPINQDLYRKLDARWAEIRPRVIAAKDKYGLFAHDGRFQSAAFERIVIERGAVDIWPRTPTGQLARNDDALRWAANLFPWAEGVRACLATANSLARLGIPCAEDGRSRCAIRPYASKTGRNQPKGGFIFAKPSFTRPLVRPRAGWALAYLDWCQQEHGIAAALSGDERMMAAYHAPTDPYLEFAIACGLAPGGATKRSHPRERAICKTVTLGLVYGQTEFGMAQRTGQAQGVMCRLIADHKRLYPKFWRMQERNVNRFLLGEPLRTPLGWELRRDLDGERTALNFPMQATGADMLRAAIVNCLRRGIRVCAPVHDAILIEAPLVDIRRAAEVAQAEMAKASEVVLSGFRLKSDTKYVRSGHVGGYGPDGAWACRTCSDPLCLGGDYHEEKDDAVKMWPEILRLLAATEAAGER